MGAGWEPPHRGPDLMPSEGIDDFFIPRMRIERTAFHLVDWTHFGLAGV